jgi:hypothetical protein
VARAAGRRPNLRSLGPHLSQGPWYVPGWRVRRRWLPASMTASGLVGQGSGWCSGQAVANVVHRVEVPWRKLCSSWADDDDVSRRRFFPGNVNRSVLFPLCGLSSLGENPDILVRQRWCQWAVASCSSLVASFWKIVLGQSTAAASVVARKVEA